MTHTSTVLIADDHPLVLKGLHDFLIEKEHNVQWTAKHGREALTLIKAHEPDIAILDIQMPHMTGIEVAQEIQNLDLKTKVILITFEKSPSIYQKSREANVYGYILKEFALDEIEKCLERVYQGLSYFSQDLLELIEINEHSDLLDTLTHSERNILKHLATNKSGKEIADELSISVRTVEKHKSSIRQKLNLDSKSATLYLFAYSHLKFL